MPNEIFVKHLTGLRKKYRSNKKAENNSPKTNKNKT